MTGEAGAPAGTPDAVRLQFATDVERDAFERGRLIGFAEAMQLASEREDPEGRKSIERAHALRDRVRSLAELMLQALDDPS